MAASVGASYGTSRAVNEYQPKGLGLFAGHGEGLYSGGAIGLPSPPPIGMKPRSTVKRVKIPIMDGMDGGRLVIDRPVTIRSIAHSINSAGPAISNTVKELKGAGMQKSRMVKGSDAAKAWGLKMREIRKN